MIDIAAIHGAQNRTADDRAFADGMKEAHRKLEEEIADARTHFAEWTAQLSQAHLGAYERLGIDAPAWAS